MRREMIARTAWAALAALVMTLVLGGCQMGEAEISEALEAYLSDGTLPEGIFSDGPIPDGALPAGDLSGVLPDGASPAGEAAPRVTEAGTELLSREGGYGVLLPYIGAATELDLGDRLPLYGLATVDGLAVTGPVYTGVDRLGPFLLLYRADGGPVQAAGRDGSWVLDAEEWDHSLLLGDRLAVAMRDGSVRTFLPGGTVGASFPREALRPYLREDLVWGGRENGWTEGGELVYAGGDLLAVCFYDESSPWGNSWRYDCFLDMETGEVRGEAPEGWSPEDGWGDWDETPEIPGYAFPDPVEDLVTGEVWYCGAKEDSDGWCDLLDPSGELVLERCFRGSTLQWEPFLANGMIGVVSDGTFRYTRIDTGEVVFSRPVEVLPPR